MVQEIGAMANAAPDTIDINGVGVSPFDWEAALRFLEGAARGGGQTIVEFLNANNSNIATANVDYRSALGKAVVLADGIGVDIGAFVLHRRSFPGNLNGTDLVPAFLTYVEKPLRVALIGGRPEVLKEACAAFSAHAPWHEFIAVSDGYFDKAQSADVLEQLEKIDPDFVLVALGSPAQELWIDRNIKPKHGRLVMGVGALFDFMANAVPRAPLWLRRLRCEWIYRLMKEPSRLWRRYLLGNPLFIYHVLRYKLATRPDLAGPAAPDQP